MSERESRPVRRISGRLTDTIKEEETQEVREVFSPRRPIREEKTEDVSKITEIRLEQKAIRSEQKAIRSEQKVIRPEQKIVRQEPGTGTVKPSASLSAEYTGKRRRIQENEAKMRSLWGALGVLTVLLIAAIIYEVILGNGIKQTGSERMADQMQEDIIVILNEKESEMESETEIESETEG